MQESLLSQGFALLISGMGVVFVFLTLLVFCTRFMSFLVARYFPEPEEIIESSAPTAGSTAINNTVDKQVIAVIQAAISEHRSKRR